MNTDFTMSIYRNEGFLNKNLEKLRPVDELLLLESDWHVVNLTQWMGAQGKNRINLTR